MRATSINRLFLTLPLLFLITLSQDFGGLPHCAEEAALQSFQNSGCHLTNITCICLNTQWINSLEAAFKKACPPPAVTGAMNFASSLCINVATVTPHFPAASTAGSTFTTTVDSPQSAWMSSTSPMTTAATTTATPASKTTGTSSWTTSEWGISTMTTTAVAAQATTAPPTVNTTSLAGNTTMPTPTLLLANFTGAGSAVHFDAEAISFVAGMFMVLHLAGL